MLPDFFRSAGTLVSVTGTVIRMTGVRPLITQMDFACKRCGCATTACFPDGKYTPPQRCFGDSCRSKAFSPECATAMSVDWQKLRIQVHT